MEVCNILSLLPPLSSSTDPLGVPCFQCLLLHPPTGWRDGKQPSRTSDTATRDMFLLQVSSLEPPALLCPQTNVPLSVPLTLLS